MAAPSPRVVAAQPKVPKVLPAIVVVGAVSAVAGYVRSQLATESRTLDRYFSKYNSPESEASRKRTFDGAVEDPRTSAFNVLGWNRRT